jgi:hypothetical protein
MIPDRRIYGFSASGGPINPTTSWTMGGVDPSRPGRVRAAFAAEFLSVLEYENVQRWADAILARPAVKRGRMINRLSGAPSEQLHERHDGSDFDSKTQDKAAIVT